MGGLFTTPVMPDYNMQNCLNVLHPISFRSCKEVVMLTFE